MESCETVETQLTALKDIIFKLKNLNISDAEFTQFTKMSTEISNLARTTKINIETLKENKDFQSMQEVIRTGLLKKYKMQFSAIVEDYTEFASTYKTKYKQRQTDRLKSTLGDMVSEEEIGSIVNSGCVGEAIDKVLLSENIHDVVLDIESRHNKILQLETTILELAELFKDLAVLIDTQQETIYSIQQHVETAKEKVEDGHTNLVDAAKHQEGASKKTKCMFLCLFIVLLVIIAPIMATLARNG
jgi:syntaxin 1B/2/3